MPKELLIADANVTAHDEFEKIFEGMDAQLIFAENGEDALLKIKLYKPDMVIADVTMPNKDGFELCKIVKTNPELKQIPFVLLAGIFEDINQSEREKAGADGVVTKPLKTDEILALVHNLLKAAPISLDTQTMWKTGAPEADVGEKSLEEEGLPEIEGLEHMEMPDERELAESQPDAVEDEEAIIELTDVVEEEAPGGVSSGENIVEDSLEQVMERQEELALHEEGLEEISLEGIDLDEPGEEMELEEVTATDQASQDTGEEIGTIETESPESLEFDMEDEPRSDSEEGTEPPDQAMEAELEEEIDRRIDLVLEEEGDKDEEDTLLELEGAEEEKPSPLDETERLISPTEGIDQPEESEITHTAEEVPSLEEEPLLELSESEETELRQGEPQPFGESSVEALEEPAEEEPPESLTDETTEDLEELPGQTSEEPSDFLDELSAEGAESIEEVEQALEELPMEDELNGLLEEGGDGLEEKTTTVDEEDVAEEERAQKDSEADAEGEVESEEILEEISEIEDLAPESVDEKETDDLVSDGEMDGLDATPIEELEELPLEELEEAPEVGEDLIEEPSGEPVEDSEESFTLPKELIKEEYVSEEELDAFQKRLASDHETLESTADVPVETSDDQVESLVRTAVERVVNKASQSVIPELTKAIVEVASARIEKVVQQIVPELAEGAIKKEIEKLQKGS